MEPSPRNIVIFGECGVGKSSLINMVAGRQIAKTSNDVLGCTEENVLHRINLDRVSLNLWDTIGLEEGSAGKIPDSEARKRLKLFLHERLATPEGIDLLLYCFRGASNAKGLPLKYGHWETYRFVFEEVCKKRVPMAMVITNLEAYDRGGDMEKWWIDNERRILDLGFQFCGHACVTVLLPDDLGEEDDVNRIEISRQRLRDLLSQDFFPPRNVLLLGDSGSKSEFIEIMTTIAGDSKKLPSKLENVPSFTCLPVTIASSTHFNLWSKKEFDEDDVAAQLTDRNLTHLVQRLKQTGGVDLLLFCFRVGRHKTHHTRTYDLFYTAICRRKVPVAIVVLGPEEEAETWWERNEQSLRQRGLKFERHIYIPYNPHEFLEGIVSSSTRLQLIDLICGDYTSGTWKIDDNAPWITVPSIRTVLGDLSWPTTTVAICDTTRKETFIEFAPGVQSSVRSVVGVISQREYHFLHVDPKSLFSPRPPTRAGISESKWKSTGLLMFYMDANTTNETWKILERFYSSYRGDITPLVVVVRGLADRGLAKEFWKSAPSTIKKHIGAYLTYYPGPAAISDAQAIAQRTLENMIQDLCLACMDQRVGVLREILSTWRRYRSQRSRER